MGAQRMDVWVRRAWVYSAWTDSARMHGTWVHSARVHSAGVHSACSSHKRKFGTVYFEVMSCNTRHFVLLHAFRRTYKAGQDDVIQNDNVKSFKMSM